MHRFAVHDPSRMPGTDVLASARVLGPESMPVVSEVRAEGGQVLMRRGGDDAAALELLTDVGRMGRVMLATCLLPPREKPYDLLVELARFQVKSFLAKSEEWQMFDSDKSGDALELWERGRALFTKSLTTTDPLEAERVASEALEVAIRANERLALAHADILLKRRFGTRPAGSATLGTGVWTGRDGDALREFISANFDLVVIPLRWRDLQPEEDAFRWTATDRWMEWAAASGKPLIAGPLIDFSKSAVPEWLYVWQHDFDAVREAAYDYMDAVVRRYGGAVHMWNLASGLNLNDNFVFTPGQMVDLCRTARLLIKQYRPSARAMIEVRQPFSNAPAKRRDAMAPLPFVTHIRQEGVQVDAIGIRFQFGPGPHGEPARDLMQVSSMLDRLHLLDAPLLVSGLGVPAIDSPKADARGWWHDRWSERTQERWIGRLFSVAMSKPAVETVFWSELYDHPGMSVAGAGLLDEKGRPRAALRKLVGMRRRLRKPLGVDPDAGPAGGAAPGSGPD